MLLEFSLFFHILALSSGETVRATDIQVMQPAVACNVVYSSQSNIRYSLPLWRYYVTYMVPTGDRRIRWKGEFAGMNNVGC
jgi:hypothetical protein